MQLAKILKDEVSRGLWKAGDVLPSIKALAERYHTSEKVPRKALEILAEEGWTVPRRSVGSILVDRGIDNMLRGRVLVYSRGTGYSYYCAAFMSILDARLLASGYKTFIVNSDTRSERNACNAFKALLKEKWGLVALRGGGARALRLVADSSRPFVLIGDGAPMPRISAPNCVARIETNGGKALPDFLREWFFSGVATPERDPALWRRLVEDMGPMRKADAHPSVHRSNLLFGYSLRFVLLSGAGLSRRVLEEVKSCYLPMVEKTGTLWESVSSDGYSCCHGFPSMAAWLLVRDALGVKAIDRRTKTVTVSMPSDIPLDWCEGTVPVSSTESVTVKWRKSGGAFLPDVKMPSGWVAKGEDGQLP